MRGIALQGETHPPSLPQPHRPSPDKYLTHRHDTRPPPRPPPPCTPSPFQATTKDGKRSAQFEHTLLITHDGVEALTARTKNSVPFWWEA